MKCGRLVLFGAVLAAGVTGLQTLQASVPTYDFYCITNNNPVATAIGEAQLFVDVETEGDPSNGQVRFTFQNTGPLASSITDVYFDDGMFGMAYIIDADDQDGCDGVDFTQGAKPPDLPGGEDLVPPFDTTQDFFCDSDSPVEDCGVNPDEWLGVVFDLLDDDTVEDVHGMLASRSLRIGVKVQGFANTESESFVNNPEPIPAPSGAVLGAMGLGITSVVQRRQRKKLAGNGDNSLLAKWLRRVAAMEQPARIIRFPGGFSLPSVGREV